MNQDEQTDALVIGAGPAGLMAAERLAAAGNRVLIVDAKPSAGRKFLMAGKSGLNLTMDMEPEPFTARYWRGADRMAPLIGAFGPARVQDWARDLGQEVFTGTSGRVFPRAMKASPLLRAWLGRLSASRVTLRTRWLWTGRDGAAETFETPGGPRRVAARATVLALGGASWARLGSDGAWADALAADGVPLAPFAPSNVGFRVNWSPAMAKHFGAPVKSVTLSAGGRSLPGEFVLSAHGVEGGGIYALTPELRNSAALTLDLAPGRSAEDVGNRLKRPRGKTSLSNHLRKTLGFSPVKTALLRECAPDALGDPSAIGRALKTLALPLAGPRPIDEAISTAGGVVWDALDDGLMLKSRPGTFCAGEMIDWDAPTGGWLITGCLATGLRAGDAAAAWLSSA